VAIPSRCQSTSRAAALAANASSAGLGSAEATETIVVQDAMKWAFQTMSVEGIPSHQNRFACPGPLGATRLPHGAA
jgi:hypothetical protein